MKRQDYSTKKVAILAPSFDETGGAERFNQGLLSAIRDKVGHAELIMLPSDESSYETILDTYEQWRALDLSSFDLVISTKAPTYVVNHPRHVLYLVHTVRVFYDMFDESFPGANETLLSQRDTIQALDSDAFKLIEKRFAIGHEVAGRLKKWNGIDAKVLHPALGIDTFQINESEDYFFMPGRLHSWKRVDLAINAIKMSNAPLKLVIAGSGEAEEELKSLAGDDPRIEFLGRVSDEDLVSLYSRALAVVFVPLREDYGYITLEAFKSGKPVITCSDSGEPLQFVKDGESGFICDPEPQSISHAMERIQSDKSKAVEMGQNGLSSISHITWPNIAEVLLDAGFSQPGVKKKTTDRGAITKVAILDMQPIDPPVGGGRLRLLGLYHALGKNIEARYIGSYDWPGEQFRQHFLSPSLEEIDIPLSEAHHEAARKLAEDADGKTVIDLAFAKQCHLSPDYLEKATEAVEWADIVIFSHPWVYPLMASHLKPNQLVVYDSQNVEGFLRAQLLDKYNPVEVKLLGEVVKDEFEVGQRAQLIITCSQDDSDLYARVYGWPMSKMNVIPNGVMASAITPPRLDEKIPEKISLGLSPDRITAIFIGSNYQPNVEAAKFIAEELAVNSPEIDFVIAGGVSEHLPDYAKDNVVLTGFLDEDKKLAFLRASDLAINPMFSGSGTNIKMFDFMAAGLPLVTTHIGARGIAKTTTPAMRVVSRDAFASEVQNLIQNKGLQELGKENRLWVEREFAWENISGQLGSLLLDRMENKIDSDPEHQHSVFENGTGHLLRLAHVTTAGQKCGIGEYTLRLIDHLPKDKVANLISTCVTTDGSGSIATLKDDYEISIAWDYDNLTWSKSRFRENLITDMKRWKTDVVLVQYHRAFFDEHMLEELVDSLSAGGMKVAVVTHRLNELDFNLLKSISNSGATLISHSKMEIESAKPHGLKIEYIPIGVEQPFSNAGKSIENRNWLNQPPVITTTGFLRNHKGIPNLIRALGLLQKEFPGISLVAQCALYPSEDSKETLDESLKAIQELKLGSSVTLDTSFLPIEQVRESIAMADIAVLPYTESDEGGSASAATCFAAGLPVVVSSAQIFHELRDITTVLENTEPESIAKSLIEIFNSPEMYAQLVRKSKTHTEHASWENVSERLITMLSNVDNREAT